MTEGQHKHKGSISTKDLYIFFVMCRDKHHIELGVFFLTPAQRQRLLFPFMPSLLFVRMNVYAVICTSVLVYSFSFSTAVC